VNFRKGDILVVGGALAHRYDDFEEGDIVLVIGETSIPEGQYIDVLVNGGVQLYWSAEENDHDGSQGDLRRLT
jgi:hypothetical protein